MQQYMLDSIANNVGIQSFGIISIQNLQAPTQVEAGVPFVVSYSAQNDSTATQTVFGYIWDNLLNQQVTGSYWEASVASGMSHPSTNNFSGITAAFSGEVRVGHITAPPACSPDGIFQCQGVDLYKCVGGNWVLEQANSTQCGYVPPVCTDGQTKCVGTTKYTCVGGQWANPVPNSTDCGYVEPCTPDGTLRCEGFDMFKCVSGSWTKIETDSPYCGYIPPECTNGTTKCIGNDKYICTNQKWVLLEANSPDCELPPWIIPAAIIGAGSIVGIAVLLMRRK